MTYLDKPTRVRFAPSPTGHLHIGGARTALYDYLLARKTGGKFILRIEDTDQKRFVPGAEEEIISGLRWLNLEWDEGPNKGGPYGPYRQSERKDIYIKYAHKLVEDGHAYFCFCTPERLRRIRKEQQIRKLQPHYDGKCRYLPKEVSSRRVDNGEPHVVRFKSPQKGITTVTDLIRGEINIDNNTIDDYILIKSDGLALYHLAMVVDDHLMKITHVIRGAEWLPTFPLHHLIYHAFGWEEPIWIHLSVFLKPSGKGKMSKRESVDLDKDGYSIFIKDMERLGYLPEAVINWIALMGWSYDDHTEFFCLSDLACMFSLEKLNPSPAAINFSKLDHFNGRHIRSLSLHELVARTKLYFEIEGYTIDEKRLLEIAPIIQTRLVTLDDAPEKAGFFFMDTVEPKPEELIAKHLSASESAEVARQAYETLVKTSNFNSEVLEQQMRKVVEEVGLKTGQVFGILRIAVTGQRVSPPLFESMVIVGKEKTLERLERAIELLEKLASIEVPES